VDEFLCHNMKRVAIFCCIAKKEVEIDW